VSDAGTGKIYKIDSTGNGHLWLQDPLLEGTGVSFGVPVGITGMALDKIENIIYGGVFEKGTLIKIPINNDGSSGVPSVVVDDPEALFTVDAVSLSPDYKTVFAANLNGNVHMIELERSSQPTAHRLATFPIAIKPLPAVGFENEDFENSLFVSAISRGVVDPIPGAPPPQVDNSPGFFQM